MDPKLTEKLFKLRRFGIKPGLERISELLKKTGNPHLKLNAVHIAGTNGKGSVSALISSILQESRYKTGLYTSPHIYSFNERIKINGIPILDSALEPLVEKYLELGKKVEATFFEITTAIAFEYFAKEGCEVCVVETGLGGRFDSTNVLLPLVSVITKIDFDHEEYLGKTLEEIAKEKFGIIKPPIPAVISRNSENIYSLALEQFGSSSGVILVENLVKGKMIDIKPNIMKFSISTPRFGMLELESPLIGEHQLDNISTAIATTELLSKSLNFSEFNIFNGIKNVRKNSGFFGRFEVIKIIPPFIIDVAHNPNAINVSVELIKKLFPGRRWNIIFAVMKDKNYKTMLNLLIDISERFLLPNLRNDRAQTNIELKNVILEHLAVKRFAKPAPEIVLFDSPTQALNFSIELNKPVLVIGSFYLLGEIAKELVSKLNWGFPLIESNKIVI